MPVRSFRHKGLKRLYEANVMRGVPAQLAPKLRDMLAAIDVARTLDDVGLYPGRKLHALKGDLAGYSSLTVSGNLRLTFRFDDGDAFGLDLIDYH